jgi:ribosomal protein S18 acetylase RimI-like enzyme
MTGIVRRATIDDVEAIARVHYATHIETYTGKFPEGVIESNPPERRAVMWTQILTEGLGEVWVAEVDGQVVGFAGATPARDEDPPRALELASIYLLATHHGSGLGQMLLDAALADRPASLWVLDDNPRAQAFYRRNGFEPDGAAKIDERFGGIREIRMVR